MAIEGLNNIPEYLLQKSDNSPEMLTSESFGGNGDFYEKYLNASLDIGSMYENWKNLVELISVDNRGEIKNNLAQKTLEIDQLDIQGIKNALIDLNKYFKSIPDMIDNEGFMDDLKIHFSIFDKIYSKLHYLNAGNKLGKTDKTDIISQVKLINQQLSVIYKNKQINSSTIGQIKKINKPKEWFTEGPSKNFDIKYGKYHELVCESIGINHLLTKSQIEKESSYNPNISNGQHIGFFQLSSGVVQNMKDNGQQYGEYFGKLDSNILEYIKGPQTKNLISRICNLAKQGNYGKEWKSAFSLVNRSDPYMNILLGNIYSLDGARIAYNGIQFTNFNGSKDYSRRVANIYKEKTCDGTVYI